MKNLRQGFTFVEIIVVIGILFTLIGIASLTLLSTRSNITIDTVVSSLITDLSSQQLKAMVGDTDGRSSNEPYGVYFEENQYTLFRGTSYSPSDISNLQVMLDERIRISSILFPSSSIILATMSGEIIGFSQSQNSVTFEDLVTGEQKTLIFNRYGIVTSLE